eukprot:2357640-Prymnesium_polylepis.1
MPKRLFDVDGSSDNAAACCGLQVERSEAAAAAAARRERCGSGVRSAAAVASVRSMEAAVGIGVDGRGMVR